MIGERSIQEINRRISAQGAAVRTEIELWEELRAGAHPDSLEVDVVIVSFSSPISGSAAMLLVPVAGRGVFTRANKMWLNGVRGYPGPAPNERLGVVDTQILADEGALGDGIGVPAGTRLLIDFLEDRDIEAECLSEEGDTYHSRFRKSEIEFARMVTYNTIIPSSRINKGGDTVGNAHLETLRVGSKILLNRATGIVLGCGTRSRFGLDSVSMSADMFGMDPRCIVENGEVTISVALAVPVTNASVLRDVCAYLEPLSESGLREAVTPVDVEIASYLKGMVAEGGFLINDSSFRISCRSEGDPGPACSCSGGAVARR